MPARAAKIEIPRWIQLAGLPVLLLFLWVLAAAVRHVVFLFLVALLIGQLLFSAIVILVVSIYMLLDFPKFERRLAKRFPPHPGSDSLLLRMEHSLTSYVKGQALVSLIIGTSAGVGLWLFGVLGWLPHGQKYALLFGAFVAITELIPYLGPWLGAIPPSLYALVVHPVSAIWVAFLFLAIHQAEGDVVV